MKEKMLEILNSKEWKEFSYYNSEENYHIENFIDYFFNKYQPERLSPEDQHMNNFTEFGKSLINKMDNQLSELICDSPNTANK